MTNLINEPYYKFEIAKYDPSSFEFDIESEFQND